MLSQKLTKEALILYRTGDLEYHKKLEATLALWLSSHKTLNTYNTILPKNEDRHNEIQKMFTLLQPYFQTIQKNVDQVIQAYRKDTVYRQYVKKTLMPL